MLGIHLVTDSKLRLLFQAMKKIITLTVIFGIIVSSGSNVNCEMIQCPPGNDGIFIPSEEYCDIYYLCFRGKPTNTLQCPRGSHFNPVRNICGIPKNVNCTLYDSKESPKI